MAKPFVRLRAKFLEEDVDQKSLAGLLHIDPSTLSKKLMGYNPFTCDEMYMICDILHISDDELHVFSRDGRSSSQTKEKMFGFSPHL